jgi:hypothetical protein
MVQREKRCLLAATETVDDSGAKPEIILPFVEAVWDFRQEVLGLHRTHREMPRHAEIQPSSGGHREIVLGSQVSDSIRRQDGSEKSLGEGRDPAAVEIDSRAEKIGITHPTR